MDQREGAVVVPACFPVRMYALWREVDARCGRTDRAASVCADCMPGYQMRMRRFGRCENPGAMVGMEDGRG